MAPAPAVASYRFARFELQLDERRLLCEGRVVPLRPLAFDVLATLVQRAGHLVSKQALLERVWGQVIVEENTLQAHISALRKALGSEAIATVVGQGYRFTLEAAAVQPHDPAATARPLHNLPQALTRFVGRGREIGEVRSALQGSRLVTLTGAGGCGKTRLALQVAEASREAHASGVWLVELAPLADPGLLAQAVVTALAIETQPGRDLTESLLEWLAPRRVLLVLDNTEHLLDACARLSDRLLRHCAGVQILATSRERLNIDGERTYRVPSLSLPGSASEEHLLASEAVQLFIDRARLQRSDFDLSAQDAAALVSICHRLDGIALAIELAAPRLRMMSLQALNARLRDRFDLLTGGSRTALPRHRTLHALVDWSHELLSAEEKAVLRRLSVFAGGCTGAAAALVCSREGIAPADLQHLLTSLVEKNLVVADVQREHTRFRMLETVRHHAQERLRASGEEEAVRDGHLACFLELARELDEVPEAAMPPLLQRIDAEHANLREALAWCESSPARAVRGLLLAGWLGVFWDLRCHDGEARGWIERLLAKAPAEPAQAAHAIAWQTLGVMLLRQNDHAGAAALHERAIAAWRRLGDKRRLGHALCDLADVGRLQLDGERIAAPLAEICAIATETRDRLMEMKALYYQAGLATLAGRRPEAQALLTQSLAVGRPAGASLHAVAVLLNLGRVRYQLGDCEGAHSAWLACAEALRPFGAREGLYYIHLNLMTTAQDLGRIALARSHLWQSLAYQPDRDAQRLDWMDCFAALAVDLASPLTAARFWGCIERLRSNKGIPRPPTRYERMVEQARKAQQDDAAFDAAWAEGRLWSFDEAMSQARALEDTLQGAADAAR